MARVHINNVVVCENPSAFTSNFQFQITFECTEELNDGLLRIIFFHFSQEHPFYGVFHCQADGCFLCVNFVDLEWKIIYVGSAESDTHDQVLDSVLVGPIPVGTHTFLFEVSLTQ